MNLKLLKILRCPICINKLDLEEEKSDSNKEIISGKLVCRKCGKNYPIFQGVPLMTPELPKDMKRVRKSFSKEWRIHKYKTTKTWRLRTRDRKNKFMSQMNISNPEVLRGKILLDGGCGNGELTLLLSDFGMITVGVDISTSIFKAYENNEKKDKVFFVQGDLMNPPFEKNTFDYIYSDGVFHHTTNTKYTFNKVAPLIKKRGKMWVWLYHTKDLIQRNRLLMDVEDVAQYTIARLPPIIQDLIIFGAALPLATFLQLIGVLKTKDTWREKQILIRDAYTHLYNFRHTPKEVESWFEDNGFKDIGISDNRLCSGFGTYGTKR